MPLHLLTGPAGSGKTAALLDHFGQAARSSPGSALWLAPTRAAAGQVRERLLAGGGLCGYRLGTFDEVVALLTEGDAGRVLSPGQRRLLLDEIVARLQQEGQLPRYDRVCATRGFLEGLEGLIDELQQAGVSATALARAGYRKGKEPAGKRIGGRMIGDRDRQCARIHARYSRELRRLGVQDVHGREAQAAARLHGGSDHPLQSLRFVAVDGFTSFTATQFELLGALARHAEVWVSLLNEPGDERGELWTQTRATRARLGGEEKQEARVSATDRPAGLAHVERQLFRPLRRVEVSDRAEGLWFVEAPGLLGEARLVARHLKELLLAGAAAEQVLLVVRDLAPYADLLEEVLGEYGVPVAVEGARPLTRNPAVGLLLRALRLPEDDWPFAGVTALLRHTYFRPAWPEANGQEDLPTRAEALLRLLGEPRGRDAYLAAVDRWAQQQQEGLEDEQAEESRRRRTHELAKACRSFLHRFFHAWDGAPGRAPLADHLAWLRHFSEDLGITRAAAEEEPDRAALASLWQELERWRERPGQERLLERRLFLRRLGALAAESGLPRSASADAVGRVRVLSAHSARHLNCDHLYLLGLGERSFPRTGGVLSLLEETDRQELKEVGLSLPTPAETLPDEMLLFYQVVTRARRQVVLSYPSVDDRGQDLLPSSFLHGVRDCFTQDAVKARTTSRRMLIQGYREDVPLSPAEVRVRLAAVWEDGKPMPAGLPGDVGANLAAAREMARQRFREKEYTNHDGLFRDARVVADVAARFGPERVFSPTALENYVACPFRFFLEHVLRLEPLEEPSEEIEVTRRGMAFHRGLARLHRKLQAEGVHEPAAEVHERVLREIADAVQEDVERAPSQATKELWRLEGLRLLKLAARYQGHWQKFLDPWHKRGVRPRPHLFEIDFGLPVPAGETPHPPLVLRTGSVEVRISGRIDRVDLAQLEDGVGFWIIDYKTGRGSHYTSGDLIEFRKLQLTLYAHAVEAVLLDGQKARPLGMAYWLVGENGPKVVLPLRAPVQWLDDRERWQALRGQLTQWVTTLIGKIREGAFPLAPRSEHCTQTCAFGQVCRISQSRGVGKVWELPLPDLAGQQPPG